MAVVVETGDYVTWVIVGVDCLLEPEDPSHRLVGPEEVEVVAPSVRHNVECLLLATIHIDRQSYPPWMNFVIKLRHPFSEHVAPTLFPL
jgi:hypothetical protein